MIGHRNFFLAAFLAAAACLTQVPGSAEALSIQGQVLKGLSHDPVSGHPVQLHVVRGDQEEPGATIRTNSKGEYQFTGLNPAAGLSFYVSTEYENAVYTEGPIPTSSGSATQDLVVYEVGGEIASVRVKNQHLIVERQPDGLHVTEIMIFENSGPKAYLGTGPNHAEDAGVRLGLPASIKGFEPGMGADAQTSRVQGRELSSLRPIPPGTRPYSFTYHVPISGRMDLSHRLYFPTETFVVMLDDPKLKVESKALEFTGTRDQGGKQYAMYTGSGFAVGQEVAIRVGGASFWANPRVYPWLAAPFAIVAALWVANRRGRRAREVAHAMASGLPQPPPPTPAAAYPTHPAPAAHHAHVAPAAAAHGVHVTHAPLSPQGEGGTDDDIRKIYLHLIAALDEGLQRGEYSREAHALIRQNLKRRLQAVLSETPAGGVR